MNEYHPYHEWLKHFDELIDYSDPEQAVCQHRDAHVPAEWSYNADSRLLVFNDGSAINFLNNHYVINSVLPLRYCKSLLQLGARPSDFRHIDDPDFMKKKIISNYFKQPPVPFTIDWLDEFVLHPYSTSQLTYYDRPTPHLTLDYTRSMTADFHQLIRCFFFTTGRWVTDFPLVAGHKYTEPTFSSVEDLFL